MKSFTYILSIFLILSCTSNTILEPPKDLIPKDTMSLLIQEMMLASSAKFIKNKNLEKNINYMTFVNTKFKIDSSRFQKSNLYYMSKIDEYIKIFEEAKTNLESQKKYLEEYKKTKDSIRMDSLKQIEIKLNSLDTIKKDIKNKKKFEKPKSSVDLDRNN